MNKGTWMHWLLASILVLLAGAVMVAAEERIEIKVEKEAGDEVSVNINGVETVVRLEDLADGESRTFDVGDHEMIVKRVGDDLTIISDGHEFGSFGGHGKSVNKMVWVDAGGENIEILGDEMEMQGKKVIVMKAHGDCDGDCEGDCDHEARTYTIHVDGDDVLLDKEMNIKIDEIIDLAGEDHRIFIAGDGDANHRVIQKIHGLHGDMVKYRCEDTGSTLIVKKEDGVDDSYTCPVTGCLMVRVEEPEMRVIKIRKTVENDEDDE